MHIPDGFLSVPTVVATEAAGLASFALGLKKLDKEINQIPKLGITGALLFAVQVFSFPLPGGTSLHLSGVPFVTLFIGPFPALFLSGLIVFLQAILFGHGGLLTWGANFINMGMVGVFVTHYLYLFLRKFLPGYVASFFAVFPSLPIGGGLSAIELSLSGYLPLFHTLVIIIAAYIPVGIVEAILTASALKFLSHEE